MRECPVCGLCFEDDVAACSQDASELQASLPGPRVIDGKYQLLRRLGQGGMGRIYKARHSHAQMPLGRDFALKIIRPSGAQTETFLELFRREARALGKLDHPNIVRVSDSGVDPRSEGLPYIVTELIEGVPLNEYCARRGPLSLEEALPILRGIGAALDHIHKAGLLHLDVKPANVLLPRASTSGEVEPKLLDFGLASLMTVKSPDARAARPSHRGGASSEELATLEAEETQSLSAGDYTGNPPRAEAPSIGAVGTPHYMAPEVIRQQGATAATDVYSLGVVAFVLLAGQVPFAGSLFQILDSHVSEEPPRASEFNPALPAEADAALDRALRKRAAQRPTVTAFIADLERAAARASSRAWRARELPRRLVMAFALTALLIAGGRLGRGSDALETLEGWTVDARFRLAPLQSPDDRVVVVQIDESSLDPSRPLVSLSGDVAKAAEEWFRLGARAVALDLLLPETWADSSEFAQLLGTRHDALTLAGFATPEKVIGAEVVHPLVGRLLPGDWRTLLGLVNLDEDADGVVRRARFAYPRQDGGRQLSWAARAASILEGQEPSPPAHCPGEADQSFWIDYRADVSRMRVVPWARLPELLQREPAAVQGKLVVLGGTLPGTGDEALRTPLREGLPGVIVQVLAVNTILAGYPVGNRCGWIMTPLAFVAGWLAFTLLLVTRRPLAVGLALLGVTGGYVALTFVAFVRFGEILPLSLPLASAMVGAGATLALRRLLSDPPSGMERT